MKKKQLLYFIYQAIMITIILIVIITILLWKNLQTFNLPKNEILPTSVCEVKGNYYDSIQEAIDKNMNNITIEIIKDTTEVLVILNRNLTIKGNNYTLSLPDTLDNNSKLGLININNGEVIIENLKIIGNSKHKIIQTGIKALDASITLRGVLISNFGGDLPSENPFYGTGLYLINTQVKSLKLAINETTFENLGYCGIYLENNVLKQGDITPTIYANITNCKFRGVNRTNLPQIGILLLGGISGTINNCIFNDYNCLTLNSYGIYYLINNNALSLFDNTFINTNKTVFEAFNQ